MTSRMDAGLDEGLDRDGDDRRGGKGARGTARRKLLSDEIFSKIDYKNPQVLRGFVTDRGKRAWLVCEKDGELSYDFHGGLTLR